MTDSLPPPTLDGSLAILTRAYLEGTLNARHCGAYAGADDPSFAGLLAVADVLMEIHGEENPDARRDAFAATLRPVAA